MWLKEFTPHETSFSRQIIRRINQLHLPIHLEYLIKITDEKLLKRLGYSLSGFIGTSSALFFVVMLAHIQLREKFADAGTVYIEYFYILMYVLLITATINAFIFSMRPKNWCGIILYKDNLIPKIAYLPVVLGCLNIITLDFM